MIQGGGYYPVHVQRGMDVECARQAVVLVPKGNGYSRGIGIVEFILKAVLEVVNFHIEVAVYFHNKISKFRSGIIMVTASLEFSLLHHLMVMMDKFLYKVLLYLQKSYDALDRECCMKNLVGYSIRPRMAKILLIYWVHLFVETHTGKHFGAPFQVLLRFSREEPLSPTIFKMVMDAVIFH